jgi:DNA-binding GntR family transcriptional regulator
MVTMNQNISPTPFESAQPRYLAVAERLSKAINQGEYGVGSLLPTESELCEKFGVSRHTVREALRKLRDLGLVTRHQGVGTRVENAEISGRYVASLNYPGRNGGTSSGRNPRSCSSRSRTRSRRSFRCPRFRRRSGSASPRSNQFEKKLLPVSLSHVYINNAFKIVGMIDTATVPIFALIEKKYGQVVLVEQEIAATMLDAATASCSSPPNTPGLASSASTKGTGGGSCRLRRRSPCRPLHHEMELHLELGR